MKNHDYMKNKVHYTYKATNSAGNHYAAVMSVPVGHSLLAVIDDFRDHLKGNGFDLSGVYPFKTFDKAQQEADKWNDFYREVGTYAQH